MPQKGPLRDAEPGVPPAVAAARPFVLASRVRGAAAPRVNLVVGGKIELISPHSHVRSICSQLEFKRL